MTIDESATSPNTTNPANRKTRRAKRWKRASARSRQRAATAFSGAHWGEIVQGPVVLPNGDIVIGLVTLPDPTYGTAAVARPHRGSGILCLQSGKWKAFNAANLALESVGRTTGISVDLITNIPEGVGAGSSTADCTATVNAVFAMAGRHDASMSDLDVLRVVFGAEKACDPLALLHWGVPVLFGSRVGKLLKVYGTPLPPLHALGFVADPGRTVSTDDLVRRQARSKPSSSDVDAFAIALKTFEDAIANGSPRGVGEAAMASGTLNQKNCSIRGWDRLCALAERVGAVGTSCSHSGTAAALLWDRNVDNLSERVSEARAALHEIGAEHVHEFNPR